MMEAVEFTQVFTTPPETPVPVRITQGLSFYGHLKLDDAGDDDDDDDDEDDDDDDDDDEEDDDE